MSSLKPPICFIRLMVPSDHDATLAKLHGFDINIETIDATTDTGGLTQSAVEGWDTELRTVASTAQALNADTIVTDVTEWLPYVDEFEKLHILLTTPDYFLRYAEIFSRGHDLPWSFAYKVWFQTWTAFYQLAEPWTFRPGMKFMALCQAKGVNKDALEVGRSLVFNRLGDLCFTRDRLLFYEMQQAAAKRRGWKRQRFSTEIAYYLNSYYVLLYGAFDHAAAMVNSLLSLGVQDRQVGARSSIFLRALKVRTPDVCSVFENPSHASFLKRIAAVRHVTAHRGVVTPTIIVQKPDHEPTIEELDEDIRKVGLDRTLALYPPGAARDSFRDMLRTNARHARYEQQTLMEDMIFLELDGKSYFINPLGDSFWNFQRCKAFLDDLFSACSQVVA